MFTETNWAGTLFHEILQDNFISEDWGFIDDSLYQKSINIGKDLSAIFETSSLAIAGRPCDAKACHKDSWNGRGNDNLGWNDLQMYFKVIKSGTNRKLVYDFLLVVYSNFSHITHRFFFRNLMWNSPMTLKYAQSHWQSYHLKAVVCHVCKMFGRQWTNEATITIFNYPIFKWRPLSSEPPRISA